MTNAAKEGAKDASETRRLTPYELIFARQSFEQDHFPAIEAEARRAGIETSDPDAFLLLANVGELLRQLLGEADPDSERSHADAGGATLASMGALLFQAFQHWRFDRRVWVVEPPLLDRLLIGEFGVGSWTLAPPHPAGYLQLPRHRLWARVDDDAPAEPVDGFFWTMIGEGDSASPPFRRLDVLLALGVREDRPGLSVIDTAVVLPGETPGHWIDVQARAEAQDFANVLPGGELRGLHALVNTAEVLKLVSRMFWVVATEPGAVRIG
jgi:hypothetical protein